MIKKSENIEIDYESDPRYKPAFVAGRIAGREDGIRIMKDIIVKAFENIKILIICALSKETEKDKNELLKETLKVLNLIPGDNKNG